MIRTATVRLFGGKIMSGCPVIKESRFRYLIEHYQYDIVNNQRVTEAYIVHKWYWKNRVTINEHD